MLEPRQSDIETAKAFLRSRIKAEQSMDYNLDNLIRIAIRRLAKIAEDSGIPSSKFSFEANSLVKRKAEEVIRWLLAAMEDAMDELATAASPENEEDVLAYIGRNQYGSNLHLRAERHLADFQHEVQSAIIAGAMLAGSLRTGAQGALHTLTRHAVAEGWMYGYLLDASKKGAMFFRSYRGSSYPCAQCDEETRYLHRIDVDPIPPYHPHCVCYIVPVYLEAFPG